MIVAAGVGETFARTVTDGPLIVAALVAVVSGLTVPTVPALRTAATWIA